MDKNEDVMEPLSEEDKQEFLNSVFFRFCPNCGAPIVQPPRGRMKIFCSNRCRHEWDSKHEQHENWKSARTAVCPVCGKTFSAVRESKRKRKYCSRACSNKGRASEKKKITGSEE